MNQRTTKPNSQVDMSEEAIDRRIRNVSQLFRLGMAIRVARSQPIGVVEKLEKSDTGTSDEAGTSDRC